MKGTRKLTISLPEPLLRRLRVCATLRNESMATVIRDGIERAVEEDTEAKKAARRLVQTLRRSPDRRTGGRIAWTRGELHER